jgi:hypothetical protein
MPGELRTQDQSPIIRRPIYVIYFQLEGLCVALRLALQTNQAPGEESRALLRNILRNFEQLAEAGMIEVFPSIINATPAADLLVIAETLRTSALCFLTDTEFEERKRSIGFNTSTSG